MTTFVPQYSHSHPGWSPGALLRMEAEFATAGDMSGVRYVDTLDGFGLESGLLNVTMNLLRSRDGEIWVTVRAHSVADQRSRNVNASFAVERKETSDVGGAIGAEVMRITRDQIDRVFGPEIEPHLSKLLEGWSAARARAFLMHYPGDQPELPEPSEEYVTG